MKKSGVSRTAFVWLLVAALLVFAPVADVAATETQSQVQVEIGMAALPETSVVPDRNAPKIRQLEAEMVSACRYGQTLEMEEYGLDPERFYALFHTMYNEGQFPWYVTNAYSYSYKKYPEGTVVSSFSPVLRDENFDRMTYEIALQELLQACDLEGKSPLQQALIVHDQLALRCVYDSDKVKNTGYELLVEGSTVCAGYSALYQDILLRLGIPCRVIISEPMNHCWNLVQLDGNWYHVDLTWDDPVPDLAGRVRHKYFLKTDSEMENTENPHYDWVTDIRCTDTTYSDAFWTEVDSQILFGDDNTCYYAYDEENLITVRRRDFVGGKGKDIYREKENFHDIGDGRKRYNHKGFGIRDGRLWVTTMEQVISMDLAGKQKKTEYTYDCQANQGYIEGFYVTDRALQLTLTDRNNNRTTETIALTPPEHSHSYQRTTYAPTCAEEGYTLAVCDCGIAAKGDVQAPLEHTWVEHDGKRESFFSDGFSDRECTVCGKTEYVEMAQIDFMAWLKKNWHYVVVGICTVVLVLNLIALFTPEKKK